MKKTIGILMAAMLVAMLFAGCSSSSDDTGSKNSPTPAQSGTASAPPANLSGNVKTGGSTSVEKVMGKLIEQFETDNSGVTIDYDAKGSGDGIKNTISGLYEIGHSSRELKTDGSEDGLDAIAYAIDGIAIVVHKDNPVENLTKQQILEIYTGRVTNWNEVGGNNALITVISRESGSGTRSAIAELIGFEKKDDPDTALAAGANEVSSTGEVQTAVSSNANAIGYMSFSDIDTKVVKTVKYEGTAISTDALKDGSYKLKREFYLLKRTGETLSPAGQAFIDFVLGAEGQKIVEDTKLLPIK